MQQEIYCTVNNCHYWSQGNHCGANKILVTSDSMGRTMPDTWDAPQATNAQATPCGQCMETCCKSFVQAGKPETGVDGIYKQK